MRTFPRLDDGNPFDIVDVAGRKTMYVDSSRLEECAAFYRNNSVEILALNSTRGFLLEDIGFLREVPSLRGLVVGPSLRPIDITGIEDLSELRFLQLSDNRQELDLGRFPHLREFRGDWHRKLRIPEHSELRALHLGGYKPKSKDLRELAELPRLEELDLVKSSIETLVGIDSLPALRKLELSYMRNLTTFESAALLPALEWLACERCPKIVDYSCLARAQKLRRVQLNSCAMIASLSFVRDMKALEHLRFVGTDVEDGDMSPLLRLQRVAFTDKRHFSHTLKQVERSIGQDD
jgi:Leucine-rich repeat (LRR) protein